MELVLHWPMRGRGRCEFSWTEQGRRTTSNSLLSIARDVMNRGLSGGFCSVSGVV